MSPQRTCCVGSHLQCWGPGGWIVLHAIAHGMPETLPAPRDTWTFLNLFADHLPCATCASHFRSFLARRTMPRRRDALVALLNDAHNEVNVRLGKRTYTLEEHTRLFAARPPPPPPLPPAVFLLVVVIASSSALLLGR